MPALVRALEGFILPLTVATAINPAMIFYEHTVMAETIFVFCTVLLALAGTLYAMEQTRGRFIFSAWHWSSRQGRARKVSCSSVSAYFSSS